MPTFCRNKRNKVPWKWWSHHPYRYLRAVWMWNLTTWVSGGHDSTGDTGRVNPKSLFHPKQLSLISSDNTAVWQSSVHPNPHISMPGSPFFSVFPFCAFRKVKRRGRLCSAGAWTSSICRATEVLGMLLDDTEVCTDVQPATRVP